MSKIHLPLDRNRNSLPYMFSHRFKEGNLNTEKGADDSVETTKHKHSGTDKSKDNVQHLIQNFETHKR